MKRTPGGDKPARSVAAFLLAAAIALALGSCSFLAPLWESPKGEDDGIPGYFVDGPSPKRGIAYNLTGSGEIAALAPGVTWWYNWSPTAGYSPDDAEAAGLDFVPMLWNFDFDADAVKAAILARPGIRYLLLLNEPNLTDQANLTPQAAAAAWPAYEALAADLEAAGHPISLVGPAMNWGTMTGYGDFTLWLDAFYASYRAANSGADPRIDCLAFHWYDYGLASMLDRLGKYGKPVWVTEMANCNAIIDTEDEAIEQMKDMVLTCETRADVIRYAWFTGRWYTPEGDNYRFASLFKPDSDDLTALGRAYANFPHNPE